MTAQRTGGPAGENWIVRVRLNGQSYGYPPCCIDAFCRDLRAGLLPYIARGTRAEAPSGTGTYVPCEACIAEMNLPERK